MAGRNDPAVLFNLLVSSIQIPTADIADPIGFAAIHGAGLGYSVDLGLGDVAGSGNDPAVLLHLNKRIPFLHKEASAGIAGVIGAVALRHTVGIRRTGGRSAGMRRVHGEGRACGHAACGSHSDDGRSGSLHVDHAVRVDFRDVRIIDAEVHQLVHKHVVARRGHGGFQLNLADAGVCGQAFRHFNLLDRRHDMHDGLRAEAGDVIRQGDHHVAGDGAGDHAIVRDRDLRGGMGRHFRRPAEHRIGVRRLVCPADGRRGGSDAPGLRREGQRGDGRAGVDVHGGLNALRLHGDGGGAVLFRRDHAAVIHRQHSLIGGFPCIDQTIVRRGGNRLQLRALTELQILRRIRDGEAAHVAEAVDVDGDAALNALHIRGDGDIAGGMGRDQTIDVHGGDAFIGAAPGGVQIAHLREEGGVQLTALAAVEGYGLLHALIAVIDIGEDRAVVREGLNVHIDDGEAVVLRPVIRIRPLIAVHRGQAVDQIHAILAKEALDKDLLKIRAAVEGVVRDRRHVRAHLHGGDAALIPGVEVPRIRIHRAAAGDGQKTGVVDAVRKVLAAAAVGTIVPPGVEEIFVIRADGYCAPVNAIAAVIDIAQVVTTIKRPIYNICHAARNRHDLQVAAAIERTLPDARNALRNRHACQATAVEKRLKPNARHAARNCHARQAAAVIKRILPDARNALRNRHARQAAAVIECIRLDTCHVLRDYNIRQKLSADIQRATVSEPQSLICVIIAQPLLQRIHINCLKRIA